MGSYIPTTSNSSPLSSMVSPTPTSFFSARADPSTTTPSSPSCRMRPSPISRRLRRSSALLRSAPTISSGAPNPVLSLLRGRPNPATALFTPGTASISSTLDNSR